MDIKKIYISGKITGQPIDEVISKFQAAEAKIRRFGFEPVSPLRNGLPFEAEWADQMGEDVKLLLKSDAIYDGGLAAERGRDDRIPRRPPAADAHLPCRNFRCSCVCRIENRTVP